MTAFTAGGLRRAARREAGLLARDRAVWGWWLVVFALSGLAVAAGLSEVRRQQATIAAMVAADRADRNAVLQAQKDWGGAAYYAFHFTFDPPSDFAFAALGRRDDLAWRHRVRMLALEGQIHEQDAGPPVLAVVGRFDFAFFVAFVLPLVLIAMLHGLQAGERAAGRHGLLEATAGRAAPLWRLRAGLRVLGIFVATMLPLGVGAGLSGTALPTLLAAFALVAAYLVFWTVVCSAAAAWQRTGEVILAALLGLWLLLAVVAPAAGRVAIDAWVPLPSGGEVVMTQREAVNDAWDLPKQVTMDAFAASHPEWAAHAAVQRPFEWKWYHAFQQVGDEAAQGLSVARSAGRLQRDRLAGHLAMLLPPVALERAMQSLARTDLRASLAYEARVRRFHAALRAFHYPRLFLGEAFDPAALRSLPIFPGPAAED